MALLVQLNLGSDGYELKALTIIIEQIVGLFTFRAAFGLNE